MCHLIFLYDLQGNTERKIHDMTYHIALFHPILPVSVEKEMLTSFLPHLSEPRLPHNLQGAFLKQENEKISHNVLRQLNCTRP